MIDPRRHKADWHDAESSQVAPPNRLEHGDDPSVAQHLSLETQ